MTATNSSPPLAFGPVPSRRLGRSLGINNVPPKTCTYACIYCQVGPSPEKCIAPHALYRPEEVAAEVSARVESARAAGEAVDYLTFVPDGEPTLDAGLAQELSLLKALGINLAVITNATLLWRADIRNTLAMADWVSVKVDAADEATWRHVNHPHEQLEFDQVLEGISIFSQEFPGVLTTETMLVSGVNDGVTSVEKIGAFIAGLNAATSYLAVPTRPPAVPGVRPPNMTNLNRAYHIMRRHLSQVDLLTGYEGDDFSSTGDVVTTLLGICAVHPMRRSAVEQLLNQAGATWYTVDQLISTGRLVEVTFAGHSYYLRPIATA